MTTNEAHETATLFHNEREERLVAAYRAMRALNAEEARAVRAALKQGDAGPIQLFLRRYHEALLRQLLRAA